MWPVSGVMVAFLEPLPQPSMMDLFIAISVVLWVFRTILWGVLLPESPQLSRCKVKETKGQSPF
jgi:hypothetical protein